MSSQTQSGAHFQLFAANESAEIRWRLLSGNNRDLGRGAITYPDAASCLVGIKEVLASLDDLEPSIRRHDHLWRWALHLNDAIVVTGGHAYDRQVRCKQALDHFRNEAPDARPAEAVMLSASRRWIHASVGRAELRTGDVYRRIS